MPLLTDDGLATRRPRGRGGRSATRPAWTRGRGSAARSGPGDDDPRVLATLAGPATATSAPTSCSTTGSRGGPARRWPPTPWRGTPAVGDGAVVLFHAWPPRDARRAARDRRRPPRRRVRRSCASTPLERLSPAMKDGSSSRSTAATRRPTSRCARPTATLLAAVRGADDVAPGGRASRRAWTGCPGLVGRLLAEAGLSGSGGPRLPVAELAVCCLAGMDLPSDEARLAAGVRGARRLAAETLLFNDTFAALRAGTRRSAGGSARDLRVGHQRGGPGARRAGRPVRRPGRDRRRSRRWVRARDVGPRGGGPGGRRPRAGDEARRRSCPRTSASGARRRDRGALPRPDRGRAGGGAGAGRRPGGARRRRGRAWA